MRDAPSNTDDVIDSRDVIARIDELTSERDGLVGDLDETREALAKDAMLLEPVETAQAKLAEWDDDNGAELKALTDLQSEAEGYADDWQHGATLIRRSYLPEYAEELCKDIGDLPRDLPGYLVIDWEATASNLEVDYTTVDFDGVEYLIR